MSQWASVGVSKVLFSISKVCLWHNNVMIKFGSEVVVNIFCFVVEFLFVFFGSHGSPSLSNDVFSNWDVSKISSGGSVHTQVLNWVVLWPVLWFVSLWEEVLSASRWVADWVRCGLHSHVIVMVAMMAVSKLEVLRARNFPWTIKIVSNIWDLVCFLNLGKIGLSLDDFLIKTKVLASWESFFSFWSGHFMVESLFSKSKTCFQTFNFFILSKVLGCQICWMLEEVLWSNQFVVEFLLSFSEILLGQGNGGFLSEALSSSWSIIFIGLSFGSHCSKILIEFVT